MKTTLKSKMMKARGFTLIELLIVVAIITILMGIAGLYYKQWMDKYNIESQARTMQADLTQARVLAMEKNKTYFVLVKAGSYQLVEDFNENGALDPSPTDTYQPAKKLNYPVASPNVTLTMDARGLISTSLLSNPLSITFTTGGATPEYDCLQLYATRVHLGKNDGGGNCVP